MKKNKFTVSIGIPAYNEGNNIRRLIDSLRGQKETLFKIEQIIVCSDASTDDTREKIMKINDRRIKLLLNKKRLGQALTQNKILEKCKSDVLVLLNADIIIKEIMFIHKLILPVAERKAELTSCKIRGIGSGSLIDEILNFSIRLKTDIYDASNKGRNIYTCHGAARAMSRKLYRSLTFTESVGEDAYSYLYCLKSGFRYEYVKNTVIYIVSPNNLHDHMLQSVRFWYSKKHLEHFFSKDFVAKEYSLPLRIVVSVFAAYFLKNPLYLILFTLFLAITNLRLWLFPYYLRQVWSTSKSTKNLSLSN